MTLRRRTISGQTVPRDLEEKSLNFVEFDKKQRDSLNLEPALIANIDETSIWARMPSAPTIDTMDVGTVPI